MAANVLQWRSEEDTLKLIGILDRDSLMSFGTIATLYLKVRNVWI